MASNHQFTRMDTIEIRDIICRKIGNRRSEKYFDHLKKLFTSQLSKSEFDKLCIRTIGRENLSLHNRLIKSLLKNASSAKMAPPKPRKLDNKNRSTLVNRGRRWSPLSPAVQSPTEIHLSRPPFEGPSVEEGEEVEQFARSPSIQSRSPVTAPLGISYKVCARKTILSKGVYQETCSNSHVLPDTRSLRTRLEKKLQKEEGVGFSMDCVNVLNNGLDVFLHRLVKPCLAITRDRSNELQLNRCMAHRRARDPVTRMLDFRVAMESNPRLLGVDSSIQLEKISTRAMEQ